MHSPGDRARHLKRRSRARLLDDAGCLVNIVSSPEMYTNEWASFSTRAFPENREARDGDIVRIVTTTFRNPRPVEDVLCTDAAYREMYARTGLEVAAVHRPLAKGDEAWRWVSETMLAPWVIYVLKRAGRSGSRPGRE